MNGRRRPVQDRFTAALKAGAPECVGTVSAVVGLGLLARHAVRPMVAVLGRPWAHLLGVPGRLGRPVLFISC